MNEKKNHFFAKFFASIFAICLFTGCATVNPGSSAAIFEHQKQLVELEDTVRRYDQAVGNAITELNDLTTRSQSMEGTIDSTIQLFDEYQRRVEQILWTLEAVRSEAQLPNESNSDTGNTSDIATD